MARRTRPPFFLTRKVEVEVIRPGQMRNEYGMPVEDPPSQHTIEANVQNVGFQELLTLPEADRRKQWIKLYTQLEEDIRGAREGSNGHKADIVVWQGLEYQVMKVQDWEMGVLDHKCVHAAMLPISGGKL